MANGKVVLPISSPADLDGQLADLDSRIAKTVGVRDALKAAGEDTSDLDTLVERMHSMMSAIRAAQRLKQ
jgi:hypothetical protein